MTVEQIIGRFSKYPDYKKYKAWSGKTCFHTCGNLNWYYSICGLCGLCPQWLADECYAADGDGYSIQYCEHSIILVLHREVKAI